MSLKELTAHKHHEAENTAFMQELIKGHIYPEVWTDFVYQKCVFYKTLECVAGAYCGLSRLPDLHRTMPLFDDYQELSKGQQYSIRSVTTDYHNYLLSLVPDSKRIMAHVYVWHMGDLFGGQMIKRLVPGTNRALEFNNRTELVAKIRELCTDDMADEACVAFDWAIRIMNELF